MDDWVFQLAAPNLVLQKLLKMQEDNVKGLFPVGGLRNYNCFGCGYQQLLGDWDGQQMWGPIPDVMVPAVLPDVLERMEALWKDTTAEGWCGGVGTLVKLLQHMQARC